MKIYYLLYSKLGIFEDNMVADVGGFDRSGLSVYFFVISQYPITTFKNALSTNS